MLKFLIPRTDVIAKIIYIFTFKLITLQRKITVEEYIEYKNSLAFKEKINGTKTK